MNRDIKILMINDYWPPVAPGGAEWSSFYLSEALAATGYDVGVATVRHGGSLRFPAGVQGFGMTFPFRLPDGQHTQRPGVLENPLFYLVFAIHLARTVARFRPDILHSQTKNVIVPAWIVSKLMGVPLVHTVRDVGFTCPLCMCYLNGDDVNRCSLAKCASGSCFQFYLNHYTTKQRRHRIVLPLLYAALWLDTALKRWCLNHGTCRVIPSHGLLKALPASFRSPGGEWNVIPHLPPPVASSSTAVSEKQKWPPAPYKRYVAYLGKLSLGKGVPLLESAVAALGNQFPDVCFLFAGKGTRPPPQNERVRFLGALEPDQVRDFIDQAACVVVPSLIPEAFNRVALDAMAAGRPVIVSDAGSLPEQVENNVSGLVFQRGSAAELTEALSRILSDSDLAKRLGHAAQERVKTHYSREKTLEALARLYYRLDLAPSVARFRAINWPFKASLYAWQIGNHLTKALAINLVKWTGKSRHKIHPKHFLEKNADHSWHRRYLRKEDVVLDIGAGVGTHSFSAGEICRRVVGTELNSNNFEICVKRGIERGASNVEFLKINAEDLFPFADNAFDAVLFLDVLEHIDNRDQALGEIHRILKPGGRLIFTAPYRKTPWKRIQRRAGLFYYADPDHKIEYTVAEVADEMDRNGFSLTSNVEPVVVDTPFQGLIDLVGGFSLSAYAKLAEWKKRYAREHPETTTGFRLVAEKKVGPGS